MKKTLLIKLGIVLLMGIVGWYFYDQIPEIVPTHRGIDGQPDKTGNKLSTLVMIPFVVLAMIGLFHYLPKLDPKKENYEKFGKYWEIIQFAIIGFFAYLYFVIIYIYLQPGTSMVTFMLIGLGIMFIILGNYMGKIRRNYFIGIKTPWTIDNEEVWNKTSRLGGRCFVLGGIVFLLQAIFNKFLIHTFIITILICVFVPIIYSYLLHKKISKIN